MTIMGLKSLLSDFENSLGFKNEINWTKTIFIFGSHIFGLYWCWHYAFPVKLVTLIFTYIMMFLNGMGITCGVHRLFTHESYKVNKGLKIFLIMCFCSCGQNSIYQWVRDHRLHHKHSDTEADPHNVNRGLFFSHIGWLMMKKNEEVIKHGKTIDMSDIEGDKIIMFQEKYNTPLKIMLCFILPITLNTYLLNEGWRCAVAWHAFIRYWTAFHFEMTVNSLAHAYGYRPYNTNINPRENRFVSAVTCGEGWHNYHHAFPFDYRAAEYFDSWNWSYAMIRWWAKMGWAYDLKEASPEMIKAVMKKTGDGTEPHSLKK